MRVLINTIIAASVLSIAACNSSNQTNEAASDTASVFDTTRSVSAADTAAVQDVKANGPVQSSAPTQYQEANGKQAPMTSVGNDTTGKQEHDNLSDKSPDSKRH